MLIRSLEKKWKRVFMTIGLLMAASFNFTQAQIDDVKAGDLFEKVIKPYTSLYSTLQMEGTADPGNFIGLFALDVPIENDYSNLDAATKEYDDATSYFNELTTTFSLQSKQIYNRLQVVVPTRPQEVVFGQEKDYCLVWVKKEFRYEFQGMPQVVITWARLKIVSANGLYRIVEIRLDKKPLDDDNDNVADKWDNCKSTKPGTKVTIAGCWNKDYDQDGVEDVNDNCPRDPGSRAAHGCPDEDNDGIPDDEDKCDSRKGPRSNSGCPISGLVLGVDGGGILPVGTAYAEEKMLDAQGSQWLNNSGLASYGLLYNIYLQYHWCTWLGLELGGMNFTTKFDEDRLKLNLDVYLMKNKAPANEVSVSTSAYQYNMAYVKLNLGNYKASRWSIKGGPMIAQAFKGFSKNETLIRINYNNGGSQSETISFRTRPFQLYGLNAKMEVWFSNKVGMTLGGWVLTGTNKFETQEVSFANLPDRLRFGSQSMQLVGVSLGFQFLINKEYEFYRN